MKLKFKKMHTEGRCDVVKCKSPSEYEIKDTGKVCAAHMAMEFPDYVRENPPTRVQKTEPGGAPSTELVPKRPEHLEKEAAAWSEALEDIRAFEILTQEDFTFAEAALKDAKAQWKEKEAEKRKATTLLRQTLEIVNGWFTPVQSLLVETEKLWKSKLQTARQEMAAKQAALLEAAREAPVEEVQGLVVAASQATAVPTTTSYVKRWTFEIEDETQIPDQFWIPDTKLIGEYVRRYKEEATIPGVRIFQVEDVRSR